MGKIKMHTKFQWRLKEREQMRCPSVCGRTFGEIMCVWRYELYWTGSEWSPAAGFCV